ncbi:Flp pilus assembly complex ATPase component TadA [Planctomycetales bacterium ZRK34]|nr:Flp pilus assembly complex ATPase component TadA [Planctomycetales bacterium ZRK34]
MEFWLYDQSANTRTTLEVQGSPILIGRDEDCTIVLRGPFVARHHAKISLKGNQLFVENQSRSALRVANRDVVPGKPVRLDFGDELQIAQYSLAMVRPGKQAEGEEQRRLLQNRLVGFEQKIHNELIERLNLRVTGQIKKDDPAYVAQILNHLNQILDQRAAELDDRLINHMVRTHMERLVTAEVVRQCTGKVQTDYRTDSDAADPAAEQAITEAVTSMVDMMPLLFDPISVQEDLASAEEAFDDLFDQHLPQIAPKLRRYIVRQVVAKDLKDIMLGFGPLQDLLEMANVTEIMVVGKDHIYAEKNGVIQPTTRSFFSDDVLMGVIERILTPVGRRVDQSSPLVDARLPDGSRVNVIIPPLSLVGPCITIRKFSWIPFTIDDLIARGSLSEQAAEFLQGCVTGRKNIVVTGGTGSGKTTLLNTLCAYCHPGERILTVEESAELQLPQPHVVSLEGRPANIEGRGAYTIRDLVRNALRMRPDRIIVGEVRGAEALDMLQAMNTGHDGSLSTLHANNPKHAMGRLETLVLMAVDMPIRAIREQIVSAVDMVVQVARSPSGPRRITHISEITEIDLETGEIRLEDIFTLRDPAQPRLRHTGYIPTFAEAMIKQGLLDVKLFL